MNIQINDPERANGPLTDTIKEALEAIANTMNVPNIQAIGNYCKKVSDPVKFNEKLTTKLKFGGIK